MKQFDKLNSSIPIGLVEDTSKRRVESKTFVTGKDKFRTVIAMGQLHYSNNGILEDVELVPRTVGQNFVIDKAAYTAVIPKKRIGYKFTNHNGKTVSANLKSIGGILLKDLPVNINAIVRHDEFIQYDEVLPGLDIFLKITPNGIEWFKTIKNSSAPRKFEWDMEEDSDFGGAVKYRSLGKDAEKRSMEMVSTVSNEDRSTPGKKKFVYTEEFKGRVAEVRDSKTRVKSYTTNVSYPLTLDAPTTFDVQAGSDDVYDTESGGFNAAGSNNYFGFNGTGNPLFNAGYRFSAVNVPAGATITSAKLKTTVNGGTGLTSVAGTLKVADSANFPAWADNTNQPITVSFLTKSVAVNGITGTGAYTISGAAFSSAIQTIINKGGWASGNAIGVGLMADANTGGAKLAYMGAYETSQANSAHLELDWTTATDVSVAAVAGTMVFTGQVPTVGAGAAVTGVVGAFAFNGQVPTVGAGAAVTGAVGSFVFNGHAPAITAGTGVNVGSALGSIVFTGFAPSIQTGAEISGETGAFVFNGHAPSITTTVDARPGAGSLVFSGHAPQVSASREVSAAVGSMSFNGLAPAFFNILPFTLTAGMYDIGPLGKTRNPYLPMGVMVTDRANGLDYLIDRDTEGNVRAVQLAFTNGLRAYKPLGPYSGPTIGQKRLYVENGTLGTETVNGYVPNNSPINNLVTSSADLYELQDIGDTLTWVAVS